MDKILIIDDNRYLRFALSMLLEDNGYITLKAGNRHKALKEVKNRKPELIILDKKMIDCDGLDLLNEIKEINNKIPVIMLTAYEDKFTEEKAYMLGADLFMTKPYDNDEVLINIKKCISNNY